MLGPAFRCEPVSGDFSLGAYGYRSRKWEGHRRRDQITISGNFFPAAGCGGDRTDLEFGIPSSGSNMGNPSLLIRALAVAGK